LKMKNRDTVVGFLHVPHFEKQLRDEMISAVDTILVTCLI